MKTRTLPKPKETPVAVIEVTQKELDFLLALVAQVAADSKIGKSEAFDFYDLLKNDLGGDHHKVTLTDAGVNSNRTGLPLYRASHRDD